ncbi:IS110 family transposase [Marinobacter sp. R17]|uniref:IS110 family transposase n=1 Tax=Marinobacter sp. R17 TaxID=2484250 RepID=UPI000F4BDAFB|nr:IS110 family transposase [Marinobacter sp. R17]ROT99277.1 IS110 family transposase [Marinobacter sp. R17]
MTAQIGIDVSKNKLDVCWLRDPNTLKLKTRIFGNDKPAFGELIQWLCKQTGQAPESIHVMMEATGVYHEALAYALYDAGMTVYVSNPHRVSEFGKSLGRRSKTDKRDSIILARFLDSRAHQPWQPEPFEVRQLKALLSRLDALDTDIQREYNRQEKAQIQDASKAVQDSIRKMIQTLEEERHRVERQVDDHFDDHPGLKNDRELLKSIPGIGRVLSAELTAMLRSRDFRHASEPAAFAGLVPVMRDSGTSVHKRPVMSKAGNGRLRAKLYMGAIVATRHNRRIKGHYERLLARGKAKMSALGAAMRKLVQMAYGVLKHQQGYDPQWAA